MKHRRRTGADSSLKDDRSPLATPINYVNVVKSQSRLSSACWLIALVALSGICAFILVVEPTKLDFFNSVFIKHGSMLGEKNKVSMGDLEQANIEQGDGRSPVQEQDSIPNNRNLQIEEGENTQITSILRCSPTYNSPVKGTKQKCCQLVPDKLSCLPNLVVLGAQKAGTTAVHSYLLLHPQISAGKKKELHVFDFDKNFGVLRDKLKPLLPRFDPWVVDQRIVVDTTPSYLADHKACPRMAKFLSPDAKFVALLREPTERIWSELKMKQRRLSDQNEFLYEIIPKYHKELKDCLAEFKPPIIVDQFRACLPEEIAAHGRISAFLKYVGGNDPKQQRFAKVCLKSESAARECMSGDYKDVIMKERMPPVPDVLYKEAEILTRSLKRCCLTNTTGILQRQNGFRGELPTDDDEDEENGPSYMHSQRRPDESDMFGFCVGCGCNCFPRAPMMSDISKNHIWRSLYYPQLVHCFMSIDRSRVLVLDMIELQRNPAKTMSRIFAHAGLSDLDVSQFSPEQVQAVFRSHYPDFEAVSGWAHQDDKEILPSKIPEGVKEELNKILRPYNRKLFDLLGEHPFEGWAV